MITEIQKPFENIKQELFYLEKEVAEAKADDKDLINSIIRGIEQRLSILKYLFLYLKKLKGEGD